MDLQRCLGVSDVTMTRPTSPEITSWVRRQLIWLGEASGIPAPLAAANQLVLGWLGRNNRAIHYSVFWQLSPAKTRLSSMMVPSCSVLWNISFSSQSLSEKSLPPKSLPPRSSIRLGSQKSMYAYVVKDIIRPVIVSSSFVFFQDDIIIIDMIVVIQCNSYSLFVGWLAALPIRSQTKVLHFRQLEDARRQTVLGRDTRRLLGRRFCKW